MPYDTGEDHLRLIREATLFTVCLNILVKCPVVKRLVLRVGLAGLQLVSDALFVS